MVAKQTNLAGGLMAESFDRKADDQDALYRWSDRRASYVAQANVASAASVGNSYTGSGNGYGYGLGAWLWARIWFRLWLQSGVPGRVGV